MKPDTPLADVARLLSKQSAELLDAQHYALQQITLIACRGFLIGVEKSGGVLDPITMERELDDVVSLCVRGEVRE